MIDDTPTNAIKLYGTTEAPLTAYPLQAGDISAVIEAGALRSVRVKGVEVIRQIDFPIRDENWASLPPENMAGHVSSTATGMRYENTFSVGKGTLECHVVYEINNDGTICATGAATASSDFVTNRAGFTLLHPLNGVAGCPVKVTHASGGVSSQMMPDLIMPSQPIKDIAGLEFDIDGIQTKITFTGDVFEMEDQRNWTDASFKTYCHPLVEPFAYTIAEGATLKQSVNVSIFGTPRTASAAETSPLTIEILRGDTLPQMLLAAQEGWLPEDSDLKTLSACGVDQLLVRVTQETAANALGSLKGCLHSLGAGVDLEVVMDDDIPADVQLEAVADACRAAGVTPQRVMALPAAYLTSYQPSSIWPKGLQPDACVEAAKSAFPEALIGAGMLTNFTEFNRCPPTQIQSDYITHTNTATVHAADDTSVFQTLEAHPHVFKSARAIGGQRRYRLGLTTIGMRTNPYGSATVPNPHQKRLTMSVWDPRARALFGAAWAVGAVAASEGLGIDAIALAAPSGPFGIISRPGHIGRPWYDDTPQARVYPIFHVVKMAAQKGPRLSIKGLPDGLVGFGSAEEDGIHITLANTTADSIDVHLPQATKAAIMDTGTFEAAVTDAAWTDTVNRGASKRKLTLGAYSVAFCHQA